jgi:hypothetical protein
LAKRGSKIGSSPSSWIVSIRQSCYISALSPPLYSSFVAGYGGATWGRAPSVADLTQWPTTGPAGVFAASSMLDRAGTGFADCSSPDLSSNNLVVCCFAIRKQLCLFLSLLNQRSAQHVSPGRYPHVCCWPTRASVACSNALGWTNSICVRMGGGRLLTSSGVAAHNLSQTSGGVCPETFLLVLLNLSRHMGLDAPDHRQTLAMFGPSCLLLSSTPTPSSDERQAHHQFVV